MSLNKKMSLKKKKGFFKKRILSKCSYKFWMDKMYFFILSSFGVKVSENNIHLS